MHQIQYGEIWREDGAYSEIDARVIGAPEDVVVNNNEVAGNGVILIENVLVDALDVVYRHR